MKIFTLSSLFTLITAAVFAQNNPCPDIQSYAIVPVTTGPTNCTSKIVVYATGDVSAQKGLNIQVFTGPDVTGVKLVDACFIVPASSASAMYATPTFTLGCNSTLTYVIKRYTASNGNCQGGTCGTTITRLGTPGGTLPVNLGSFFAQRKGAVIALSWTTLSEVNVKEFIVERNTGSGFIAVGNVAAINNPNGYNYSFNDQSNGSRSVSQYRLKVVDKDGNAKNSEIRTVKGSEAASDFTIYPNPSVGTTKVSVTDISEDNRLQLIDNTGKIIKTIEMRSSSSVELTGLQKGVYLVRISNAKTGESVTKKLSVVN